MHKRFMLFVAALTLSTNAISEILIAAPPIAPRIEMERSFRPFVRELSKALDQKVRYIHSETWLDYSRDLRGDKFDLLLSEAHILSLTLLFQNSGGLAHEPLLAMDAETSLYLISDKKVIKKPKQLVYKNICVKPSPSLDSVQLYRLFRNPISQPNIVEIRGSYTDIEAAMLNGKCVAMVAHEKPSSEKLKQHIIHDFKALPQIGWTMTSRLTPKTKSDIKAFFNSEPNQALITSIFQTVTESPELPTGKIFTTADYKGLDKLLEQVWGW